ncbi:helicase C-terminal domain-containing protein [Opitutus terrae]|uniref:Helicase c2 n=1 Tax=Opitutus terrae (strain DSM 11246 / JCM 15787 / PB90-1) TaxID=452637 RepID=B1ZT08_OPITP|nr:helicase C-terminal domain-containing protein [Opitutus terrae]ACB75797.1 helicase c2 [Opitutus terrae PB90-1]
MLFDLDQRTASLSVGEFSSFTTGPRDSTGGAQGLWRAQLGTHWHNALREQATAERPETEFEIPITGRIVHHGWTLTLTGRIDQLLRERETITLREIKTVTRDLPTDETELRAAYPDYFAQLAAYLVLARAPANPVGRLLDDQYSVRGELVFVEVASGLAQTVPLTPADDTFFRVQLARVAEFLDLRLRARERLRHLTFRPAFAVPRPGQETTQADLTATFERHPLVLFEAPTGFGKTGVLLEFALGQLRGGHFDRALYLTSKSTGQIQVVRTLSGMTAAPSAAVERATCKVEGPNARSPSGPPTSTSPFNSATGVAATAATPVAVWHVRNKSEHCINATFHCVRDVCSHLVDAEARWATSGLARFYLDEKHPRDLDTLRAAGRAARICPYEITRAALAFNDVWIGDYNYVFAPRNRGLFFEQPGFDPARTLLLLDEAHNLPSRVADAYSHAFRANDAFAVRDELHRTRPHASLVHAWGHWCHFLDHLRSAHSLTADQEDDARDLLGEVAKQVASVPLDLATLGPQVADLLWQIPSLVDELAASDLPRLWWTPQDRELALTCLDAAPAIGATLREFGGVVLASATLTPIDGFAAACGLQGEAPVPPQKTPPAATTPERLGELNKRTTKKLFRQLTSAAELLRVEEAREASQPTLLRAHTPWRDGSYDIACDVRVDTTFQHRTHHYTTTAATIASLHRAARAAGPATPSAASIPAAVPSSGSQPSTLASQLLCPSVAVFFPSYAYADAILREIATIAPELRVALQPRIRDLAAQSAWVEESLRDSQALFLVLGSSFAESIDALGGRVSHALVVGPALPEVNPVQHARLAEATRAGLSRDAAFRRVYQIPGMTKVNQALGRLVRAPGQHAKVLLHCRRFVEPSYASLLAPDYRNGVILRSDADLAAWLAGSATPARPVQP